MTIDDNISKGTSVAGHHFRLQQSFYWTNSGRLPAGDTTTELRSGRLISKRLSEDY